MKAHRMDHEKFADNNVCISKKIYDLNMLLQTILLKYYISP